MVAVRVGSPVRADNFFDRELEIRRLWKHLLYLLAVLHSDGYLVEDNHRHRFQSPLLRAFWIRRFSRSGVAIPRHTIDGGKDR